MAAKVLNSPRAVQMSLFIVRAFLRMREGLASGTDILTRMAAIDRKLLVHDAVLRDVYRKLLPLLSPPPDRPKREIGFQVKPGVSPPLIRVLRQGQAAADSSLPFPIQPVFGEWSMSASSTLNRAVRILGLITPRDPVDVVLRRELTHRRDLSPGERRGIVKAIAAYFRWLGWLDAHDSPQRRVEAALALQARFDSNSAAVKPEALAARAVPEWLAAEMDAIPHDWLRQLQRDPPLWIRVRQQFADSLPQTLEDCSAASPPSNLDSRLSTIALRLPTAFRYTGTQDLFLTEPFQRGQFEIQDLASQLVGHACAPAAGETWWDACAGEGGKTLHLADLMQNKGLIWASDRSLRRIDVLKKRAARAEVFNYRTVPWSGGPTPPTRTRFDGVLVDAPCSGVGTWQRHPHARWTVSPAEVHELALVQQQLLDHVAGSVKPGGRLIYSVCTLTRAETSDTVDAFTRKHPEFKPVAVFPETAGQKAEGRSQAPAVEDALPQKPDLHSLTSDLSRPTSVLLWPHELNSNGMFIAAWRRQA